jgi:hypothetical protein
MYVKPELKENRVHRRHSGRRLCQRVVILNELPNNGLLLTDRPFSAFNASKSVRAVRSRAAAFAGLAIVERLTDETRNSDVAI